MNYYSYIFLLYDEDYTQDNFVISEKMRVMVFIDMLVVISKTAGSVYLLFFRFSDHL